jgi:hypothetical protein
MYANIITNLSIYGKIDLTFSHKYIAIYLLQHSLVSTMMLMIMVMMIVMMVKPVLTPGDDETCCSDNLGGDHDDKYDDEATR